MFTWLKEKAWMLTSTISFVCLLITIGGILNLRAERDRLDDQINHPVTGYIARLDQCHTNGATLQGTIDHQNGALQTLRDQGETRIKAADKAVAAAQASASAVKSRLDAALSTPLKGDTVCERAQDLDNRFVETLQ